MDWGYGKDYSLYSAKFLLPIQEFSGKPTLGGYNKSKSVKLKIFLSAPFQLPWEKKRRKFHEILGGSREES